MTAVKVALAVKVELGIVYQLLGGGGIRLLFVSIKLFLILLVFGCYDILVLFYPLYFPVEDMFSGVECPVSLLV